MDEATEGNNGLVGITTCGCGDVRNGDRGGGEICSPLSEHHSPLNYDLTNTVTVP